MTPEEFLKNYENALATQNWHEISPFIHENSCVTFSDGKTYKGKSEVKKAFERNFSIIKDEDYSMSDIYWILKTNKIAVYNFTFKWKGLIDGKFAQGEGKGTSVLVVNNNKIQLLSEHLTTSRI